MPEVAFDFVTPADLGLFSVFTDKGNHVLDTLPRDPGPPGTLSEKQYVALTVDTVNSEFRATAWGLEDLTSVYRTSDSRLNPHLVSDARLRSF